MVRAQAISQYKIFDSEYWRNRAEEAQTVAEGFTDPEVRAAMARVVRIYEKLAEDAERRVAREKSGVRR